jgi:hypothetical protein
MFLLGQKNNSPPGSAKERPPPPPLLLLPALLQLQGAAKQNKNKNKQKGAQLFVRGGFPWFCLSRF